MDVINEELMEDYICAPVPVRAVRLTEEYIKSKFELAPAECNVVSRYFGEEEISLVHFIKDTGKQAVDCKNEYCAQAKFGNGVITGIVGDWLVQCGDGSIVFYNDELFKQYFTKK